MTQFEVAQQQVREGKTQTPLVMNGTKKIDYFGFQLSTHLFNLKIMSTGMSCRGIKFNDIKKYYGLTGRSAKDCLPQFEEIIANYKAELNKPTIDEIV